MDLNASPARISANPKAFFLYLLAVIALYASLISFIGQVFDYINLLFPDPLNRSYWYPAMSIRWNIAVLIIAFPTYLVLFSMIRREYLQFPEKKELVIRKWAIYLAIFVASIVILCDVITLLYYFLNGDFTSRFLLKILVILLIFAWLLYFSLRDLKFSWSSQQLKLTGMLLVLIAAAGISYGFTIIGSPFKVRQINLDNKRIGDLNNIQGQIIQYWIDKNKLPASLEALTSNISGFKAPQDPQTGKPYDYRILSKLSFELCANFDLASATDSDKLAAPYSFAYKYNLPQETWNWQHEKSHYCFQRTIDPQRYKNKR